MMRDMIARPVQCTGLEISEALVHCLIRDSGSEPGNLPLLAFVLERLFNEREGSRLSEAVYESFGGIAGAIAAHVQGVENELRQDLGEDALARLPSIFPRLLKVDADGLPTRQRAARDSFSEELGRIV